MLIMAEERFHLAILPLLAALAGRGLTQWPMLRKGLQKKQSWAKVLAAVVALLVLLAFLNWGLELSGNAEQLALLFGPQGSSAHFNY